MGDRIECPERGVGDAAAGRAAGSLRERALVAAQTPDLVLGPQQRGPVGAEQLPFEAPPVRTDLAGGIVDIVEAEDRGRLIVCYAASQASVTAVKGTKTSAPLTKSHSVEWP